jgi:CRP/FNR family cyclic AMP-dependent transcriptional regulator
MIDDKRPALMQSAVFEGIADDVAAKLCSRGRTITFEMGKRLFERGDEAQELMILSEGAVELLFPMEILGVTRDVTMESKHAGEVVAWSALVSPFHFTLSARCASRCILLMLAREALLSFFETDPSTGYLFMRNLAGVIGRRLQALQTMWVHDLQASAVKRLG